MTHVEKILRQLTIRAFHVDEVVDNGVFAIKQNENSDYYKLSIDSSFVDEMNNSSNLIVESSVSILKPEERNLHVNSIMDIIPVSVKALGRIGEGITHTLTGVYVVLTGHDVDGNQICAFGNSDGNLDKQIMFGKAGTPDSDDIIILVDVSLQSKAGFSRPGPDAVHEACDLFCNKIREKLVALKGRDCTESHMYSDVERPGKRRVAIVKMVPGQGAMYDCRYLSENPSGFTGGHSVIDAEGAPMILSPNEYRDGAIRALV